MAIDQSQQLPRGRHGLPREAVADSQRRRISRAMVEVVAERGYAEARIADVIASAGVSRKTYYELFADKEDCFLATFDAWFGRLFRELEGVYEEAEAEPWAERIRRVLEALVNNVAKDPAAARFCVVEVMAAGPKALTRRDAAIRQFTHFLDAGRTEGGATLPGLTSLALVGGINELLYSEIIHGATAQMPSRVPDLLYWATQPYLGEERAAAERERARQLTRESDAGAAPDRPPQGVPG